MRLDSRIAALSDAGHATADPQLARAKAREMIAMYDGMGARQLVAECLASAASTARFAGELAHAVDWCRQAGQAFQDLGLVPRAAESVENAESLLQQWANSLRQKQDMPAALPVLLQLAEISARLGHSERRATALYNAAIGLACAVRYEQAAALAAQAAQLDDPTSDEAASAGRLHAYCLQRVNST